MPNNLTKPESIGLPPITFLYTMDQVAAMLQMDVKDFQNKHVYFYMRTTGPFKRHMIRASNIAAADDKPDWRIAQNEFIRWLRLMGFRVSEPHKVY